MPKPLAFAQTGTGRVLGEYKRRTKAPHLKRARPQLVSPRPPMMLNTMRVRALALPALVFGGSLLPAGQFTTIGAIAAAGPARIPIQVGERLTFNATANALHRGKTTTSVE